MNFLIAISKTFFIKDSLLIYKYKKNISSVFSELFREKSPKTLISKQRKQMYSTNNLQKSYLLNLPMENIYGESNTEFAIACYVLQNRMVVY